ncbi:DMT family transporter [Herbaspirillum autotrophicum]|uniref:DMT family transporter n=1 Tax=Herbaspirillum autotrophicum TaxID=180195 RepID=UPI00067DA1B9|nr:DMT family transporter [Herbaspirillum autotrophicum]
MDKRIRHGSLEMTGAMLISGSIGWFVVASGQPVLNVVFWRCLFGALALLAICAWRGLLRRDAISLRVLGWAALGGVAIVVNWVMLFAAYSRASIAVATTVYNTQPLMLVILGALLLRERIALDKLFWLGVAFAGMLVIVNAQAGTSYASGNYMEGIGLALGAAFLYAIAAMITKRLSGTPPHLIALIQVSVGILLLAPLANFAVLPVHVSGWGYLVTMGVLHTGVMYVWLYGAIQKLPTVITGTLAFIYPVAAIAVDWIAFGHRLQLLQWCGIAAILLATAGMSFGWRPGQRQLT